MSFRRFHTLFHHVNNTTKHKHKFYNYHQHRFLFTPSQFNNLKSFHNGKHIFPKSTYSNQINNNIYSKCFNIIYNHIKHNYSNHSLFNTSFNRYYKNRYPYQCNANQLLFKRFASMDVSKDYYKILGINKNAAKKEIRSSYLTLAKQWHPDLHKNDVDKKKARDKFIEIQEAYEVLHDDNMRKKYDEMRRYGMSQEQYKYHEAYQRQTGQSGFTNRSAGSGNNAWEDEFRRNMQSEWDKIRREQKDWASTRRSERHKYADQFPFGDPRNHGQGFAQSPFGAAGGSPFGGFGPFGQNPNNNANDNYNRMVSPLDGFFRTLIYVFAFFMMLRLVGFMLFGPSERRRGPYDPYGPNHKRESPFYNPSEYNKYNQGFPPPLSLREKGTYKNRRDSNEAYDNDQSSLQRKQHKRPYTPPPPHGPKPKNSLRENENRKGDGIVFDEEDGNEFRFSKSSTRQSNDPVIIQQRRNANKKKKSKYEKMLEEQRMMEEVYIRARRKQMEEQEWKREQEMNRKFGRKGGARLAGTPHSSSGNDHESDDVNEAWERYLNSKTRRGSNWRDNK